MAVDALRDGFVRLCLDPSLNVIPGSRRVLFEGQYFDPELGCTVVPDKLVRVNAERDIDCMFGAGSVLAESLKVAMSCCGQSGIDFYAIPRADAAGAQKAAYTITIAGTATSEGRVDIFMGDAKWNTSTRVTVGMTAAAIATAIAAAIPSDFPYTATSAAGVVSLTAKNGGTIGNFLSPAVHWHGRSNYFPSGITAVVAQSNVGSVDPAPLDYSAILGECCYCGVGILSSNDAVQDAMISTVEGNWSCLAPQCFGHAYMFSAGSLGSILASARNKGSINIVAHGDGDPSLPYLTVAAYTAKSCCETVDNPEISVQGPAYGVLSCLRVPESCTQSFTFDEQVQLRENGFVVVVPVAGGSGGLTNPMITNDSTNYLYDDSGKLNLTFRDTSSRRLAASTAVAVAEKLQSFNGLGLYTKNTNIAPGTIGTNPRMMLGNMRAWARDKVGSLFSEFENIDREIRLVTDFEVQPKCHGTPGKLYLNLVYRPPVRIKEVVANLQPKLLDNCQ